MRSSAVQPRLSVGRSVGDRSVEHSQLLLRVRPCEKPSPLVRVHEKEGRVEVGEAGSTSVLHFDGIFRDDQQELFAELQPALLACIGGASCTVLTHGGPQSGKSYALSGLFTSGETHGICPRAIQAITEEIEHMSGAVPNVEASFFELQQDGVCDLLAAGAPRVAMRETTQPPFVALDQHLSAMRCDGASGFNRLLDAYFTGLEHRKKGNHTCFQITFSRNRRRSHLRLIEMAWPRPQAGKGAGAGKASLALEQVLQAKLSGVSCGYRGAPLALLLKPCLEGLSSLCFIHCLRTEPSHLSHLVTSAPLLTKIFQWLSQQRKSVMVSRKESTQSLQSVEGEARRVVVPPLHLGSTGGSCTLSPAPVEPEGAGPGVSSPSSSSSRSSKPPMMGATSEDTVGGEGGTGEASMSVKPLTSDTEVSGASVDDSPIIELLSHLLEVKRGTAEALEQDAKHSSGAFQELDSLLGNIISAREANGNGPDERETNLKLVYEQVYRSIQRSTEEATKIRHEIQELESFCKKGYIPPVYDAYAASQQDVEKLKAMKQASLVQEKEPKPLPQVIEIPQLPLSCLQGEQEVSHPYVEGIDSQSSSGSSSEGPEGSARPKVLQVSPPRPPVMGCATVPTWAQACKEPGPPPTSLTPPVPVALTRAQGAGSPMMVFRPVLSQGPVQVGSVKVAPRQASASETVLGKALQASPPRFHSNGRAPVPGPGGSMTVGPGAVMCQAGSPMQGFRTISANSPVLMTRTLQVQGPAVMTMPPRQKVADPRGTVAAAALRGSHSAAELPRPWVR